MEETYRYYFVKDRTIECFITEMPLPNFVELTDEQYEFWQANPNASIQEVKNCQLNQPCIAPVLSLSELKEIAIDEIDKESRSVIGSFVDVLTFSNTVASTIYAKAKGITPIYDDEKVLKTATDFLVNGKQCKDLYNETIGLIDSASTKEEIDTIVDYAKSQYSEIRNSKDTIEKHKIDKLQEIELYDTSDNVNSFYYNGNLMWLDKETRISLMNTLELSEKAGKTTMNIWFGDTSFNFEIETAKSILTSVEMYAMECYNVTAQHRVSVKNMTSIEEIDNFDVTTGYPERLSF